MKECLAKKKRIRAGHKASTTKVLSEVDALLAEETPEPAKLSGFKLRLEEKLETIKLLDTELLNLIEEEEVIVKEIERADLYKEGIYQAMVKIDQCCAITATHAVAKSLSAVNSSAAADIVDATSAHVIRTTTSNRVKLPQLTLHPFNGDKTTWSKFWDLYESAVHNNDELSDLDKFNYLRSLLEKSAYDSNAGLPLTAANYDEAIAILKKRFGNKQQIISKHMDILLSAEAVTSASNLKGFRKLWNITYVVSSHLVWLLSRMEVSCPRYS